MILPHARLRAEAGGVVPCPGGRQLRNMSGHDGVLIFRRTKMDQDTIAIGDTVLMPFMGADVEMRVTDIPEDQPFMETDDVMMVVDQYGDEHLVENDGEFWVTFNPVMLSPEGYDVWCTRAEAREVRTPGM